MQGGSVLEGIGSLDLLNSLIGAMMYHPPAAQCSDCRMQCRPSCSCDHVYVLEALHLEI